MSPQTVILSALCTYEAKKLFYYLKNNSRLKDILWIKRDKINLYLLEVKRNHQPKTNIMYDFRSKLNSKNILQSGCKTRQQITAEYGWRSVQTLRTKLIQNEIKLPNGSITPKWQKIIYDCLGYPPGVPKTAYLEV